jgi:hypothetical protein
VQTKDFGQLNSVIIYQHYKAFIAHLDKIGADLSKVRVGKAEAVSLLVHEHTMPREQVADRRLLLLQRDGRLCGGELICTCRHILHLTGSSTCASIEHVGKASKKKQQLLDGIKHILHIGNDESEEQKSEDQKKKAEEDEKKGKDGSDSAPTSKRDDFKRAVFYG